MTAKCITILKVLTTTGISIFSCFQGRNTAGYENYQSVKDPSQLTHNVFCNSAQCATLLVTKCQTSKNCNINQSINQKFYAASYSNQMQNQNTRLVLPKSQTTCKKYLTHQADITATAITHCKHTTKMCLHQAQLTLTVGKLYIIVTMVGNQVMRDTSANSRFEN